VPAKGSGNYQAYLLRLWRDSPDASWRASLEMVQNGEFYAFANVGQLFRFLNSQTEGVVADRDGTELLDEACD
jgi:hypothetical protein